MGHQTTGHWGTGLPETGDHISETRPLTLDAGRRTPDHCGPLDTRHAHRSLHDSHHTIEQYALIACPLESDAELINVCCPHRNLKSSPHDVSVPQCGRRSMCSVAVFSQGWQVVTYDLLASLVYFEPEMIQRCLGAKHDLKLLPCV